MQILTLMTLELSTLTYALSKVVVYMIVLGMPDVRWPTIKYFVESIQPNKS